MAIMIKTTQEIEKMRISGKALRQVHNAIAPHVVPGASTMDLEEIAVKKIAELGAIPAFKGYHGYPAALCTSVNDEVVHGIPSAKRVLKDGDILSIDCGVIIDGFYSDAAVTYPIGQVAPRTARLLEITQALPRKGHRAVPGRRPPRRHLRRRPGTLRGRRLWRRPRVCRPRHRPRHARRPPGPQLRPRRQGPPPQAGMVLAIEPMINAGGPEVRVLKDGWTAITVDGSYSAHFEHTVAITKDGPQVLTL